ncbi:unnamed protein product [Rotaria sp. Silwood2]|nr:unnamed protein product [Rotaria sp. Silwood2]CAF3009064.1 unnamed protein product [Rotaria sp. Silwood2]CAF4016630.1 unnamed protein product [Rotaria sp. Silwood2]CAF4610140.1 unnamed protein product [Rotaria sp. Silwood2]
MSTDAVLISSFTFATMQINRHVALFVLLFGTVGNLLNIWVLSEHSLSDNPCSTYLWWSSLSSAIFIWSGALTRVLQGYNLNWPNTNQPVCKTRLFILTTCFSVAVWTLVGASSDRYLRSSALVKFRNFSTVQTARRILIIIITGSVLVFLEVFYCYEASVPNVPVACYPQSLPCRLYNDWMLILFTTVIPSCFMAVFGSLTIRNIRTRVVQPVMHVEFRNNTANQNVRLRLNDRNINHMLLIQVLVVLLMNLPVTIHRLYASLTANFSKTALRVAIENLIYSLVVLFSFFSYSISFYLYILTGSIYRAALKRVGRRLLRRIGLLH